MTELVFVICLALSPHQCEQRSLSFSDVTPIACALGAQGVLAQWRAERPGWRIARWRCGPAGADGMKA